MNPALRSAPGAALAVAALLGTATVQAAGGCGAIRFRAPLSFPMSEAGWLAVADVNRDGRPDVLAVNDIDGLGIWLGRGDGRFTLQGDLVTYGEENGKVLPGDFNGDRRPDIAVALPSTNSDVPDTGVAVLLGTGHGFDATSFDAGESLDDIGITDLNGDRRSDIVVSADDGVKVFLGLGNGAFRAGPVADVANNGGLLGLGDLNRDGKTDLVLLDTFGDTVQVLLGRGNGTFRARSPIPLPVPSGSNETDIVVADLDRDGRLDVATVDYDAGKVTVLLGRGDGRFGKPHSFPAPGGQGAFRLAVADFDHDGLPDLAVANFLANGVAVLRGRGDGTFRPPGPLLPANGPGALAVADVNRDGLPDLVAAEQDQVSVFLNRTACQPAR